MRKEIQNSLRSCMTVADLKQELENYDDNDYVLFVCNYGDYHRTQQALPLCSSEGMSISNLKPSAYSRSEMALVEDDGDEEGEDQDHTQVDGPGIVVFQS